MDQPSGPNEKPFEKSEERVIRGAEAIAEFIFGDRSHRRKRCTTSRNAPRSRFIGLGSTLCLRPSAYKAGSKVRNIALS